MLSLDRDLNQFPELAKYLVERFDIKTVLDVGANVGDTVAGWLGAGVSTVHALEPVPSLFARLEARYSADARVRCSMIGLSDEVAILRNQALYNCWSLLPVGDARLERSIELKDEVFDVEVTTLDRYLEHAGLGDIASPFAPDLIKIDVDGMEAKVLRGGAHYFADRMPVMLFEMSYLPKAYGDDCEAMVQHIFDLGYSIQAFHVPYTFTCYCDAESFMDDFPWHTSFDVILLPRLCTQCGDRVGARGSCSDHATLCCDCFDLWHGRPLVSINADRARRGKTPLSAPQPK